MPAYKSSRTSEDIKREIIAIIRELKDPRISGSMLTVVRVELTSDNSFAKVFVSSLSGIADAQAAVKVLNGAVGIVRREVGGRLHLRKAPEIKFVADDSVEQGIEMFKRLDAARKESKHED
ncbi:MAG: 30S ribosome-binding factor RbfA [Oscillospiraceae bacterium]|jgi:ribosome-binding factor A|nr:30S ribosome-binding factor RbfA [Oscillospiraceae bacterium]